MHPIRTAAAAGAFALSAGAADALTVTAAFELTLSGNTNVPTMTLVNTGDAGFRITGFGLSAGPTNRGWDYVQSLVAPAGGTATLLAPDDANNGARAYAIEIGFTDFDATEQASWIADLDTDTGNLTLDYRTTLFNNGSAPNAALSVAFESLVPGLSVAPFAISFDLPDGTAGQSAYVFSGLRSFELPDPTGPGGSAAVPVPAAAPLLIAAMAGLAAVARRSRRG